MTIIKTPAPPQANKGRKRSVSVLSMNVAGTDATDFGRAVKKMKPDIILTQENPGPTHAFTQGLNATVRDVNGNAATKADVDYSAPILVREFPQSGLHMQGATGKSFVCHANTSNVKQYGLVYNKKKYRLRRAPALVDYTQDANRRQDLGKVRDATDAADQGFGARPPLYFELEQLSDKTRIGVFNWHAPPPADLHHGTAMDMFEEAERLQASMQGNHLTIIAGDFNEVLDNRFGAFDEGVSRKYDNVLADKAASHRDLQLEHGDVLNDLSTAIKDHYAIGTEFTLR